MSSKPICLLTVTILATITLSGCGFSWLSPRETDPVIQDYTVPAFIFSRSTNVFATTASRRLVIVTEEDIDDPKKPGKKKNVFLTCAEPSPDVGETFASAISSGLKGAATVTEGAGPKVTGELAAEYARAVATQIAPLLYRSQGIQLYRDSIYKLCIDRMNDWIGSEDYKAMSNYRFDKAMEVIKEELKFIPRTTDAFSLNMKGCDAKCLEEITKVLKAQKGKP
jgi:hypothetical protein